LENKTDSIFETVIRSPGTAIFIVTYYYHDKLLAILKKEVMEIKY